MGCRIHFISGAVRIYQNFTFVNGQHELEEALRDGNRPRPLINFDNVESVEIEQEGTSGILKPQTPDTIKEAEKKKREEIIKDPAKILSELNEKELP